jgi:hypothetical protein
MKRVLVLLACSGLVSCNFAVKHPAVTAGVVAGTIALGSCELASSDHQSCFAISGGGGLAIGVITAVALWIGYEDDATPGVSNDTEATPVVDPTNLPPATDGPRKLPPVPHTGLPPATDWQPPVDAGAGVDSAPPADAP